MVEYKERRFDASKQIGDVLFIDSSADLSDYLGNKVIETEEGFEMHSVEDGAVIMRVLPRNEIFNTFKYVRDDKGNLVEIPDENDYLQLEVYGENVLEVIKEKGDVIIKHHTSERGKTIIRHGKNTLELDSRYENYEPYSTHRKYEDYSIGTSTSPLTESSETVPLTIRREGADYDFVFDANNSFSYVSPDDVEKILPVSLTHVSY